MGVPDSRREGGYVVVWTVTTPGVEIWRHDAIGLGKLCGLSSQAEFRDFKSPRLSRHYFYPFIQLPVTLCYCFFS